MSPLKKREKNYSLSSTFVPLFLLILAFFSAKANTWPLPKLQSDKTQAPAVATVAERLVLVKEIRVSNPNLEVIAPSANFRIF
jgi:hypothetical protein